MTSFKKAEEGKIFLRTAPLGSRIWTQHVDEAGRGLASLAAPGVGVVTSDVSEVLSGPGPVVCPGLVGVAFPVRS